jgi:sulfur-carrier protein adenylyltransferase/sulfurtransferase
MLHNPLSPDERARYSRQIMLPQFGTAGQIRLRSRSALVVGLGGLGSPASLYLAAAGVGRLGLVDFDVVDTSNLHRQILHSTHDIGRSKLDSACERLHALNPHVALEPHDLLVSPKSAQNLVHSYDIVLDCSDNLSTRYALNDACLLACKPLIYGAVYRFEGQCAVFNAPTSLSTRSPCFRCLFPQPLSDANNPDSAATLDFAPACDESGVLPPIAGIIGSMQAMEALKILARETTLKNADEETLAGRLLVVDALTMRFSELRFGNHKACRSLGQQQADEGGLDSSSGAARCAFIHP